MKFEIEILEISCVLAYYQVLDGRMKGNVSKCITRMNCEKGIFGVRVIPKIASVQNGVYSAVMVTKIDFKKGCNLFGFYRFSR